MDRRLDGKVALITGTGGGQGRAAALRFAREGAIVMGCDISAENNAETVAMVAANGHAMIGRGPVDLGDPAAARAWVEEMGAVHGRIDILYNNASAPAYGSTAEMTLEQWDFGVRNELSLVFYVTRSAWPFLARHGGVVISTASTSAWIVAPNAGHVSHNAAKGAVLAMSRAFAADGREHGIRAVTISPGAIRSPGLMKSFLSKPGAEEFVISKMLTKRIGEPEDVAALAAFLASDEAEFINGADIIIDGGLTTV